MLPNVSDVLTEWAIPVNLITRTTTTVDFVKQVVDVITPIYAVVQPTSPEALKVLQVDYSLRHMTLHSVSQINNGQFFTHNGIEYKVISPTGWTISGADYGYTEAVGEQQR